MWKMQTCVATVAMVEEHMLSDVGCGLWRALQAQWFQLWPGESLACGEVPGPTATTAAREAGYSKLHCQIVKDIAASNHF